MELKKNIKADVSKRATSFFLIGLLIVQLVTLGAFSYTWYEKVDNTPKVTRNITDDEVIETMEITEQSYYVPPPPPPTAIEIVDDDVADDNDEIMDTDFDEQKEIQTPIDYSQFTPGGTPGAPPPTHVEESPIFTVVEIMPEFPGGVQAMYNYIAKNFKYPDEARRFDVEGRILISFLVDEKGKITEVKALLPSNKQLGFGLEAEGIRVVESMPQWKPGYQRNKAVRVRYTLPINCTLN